MTPELRALLERIERAGGPVKPSVKTAGMFYALLPHTPHHPLTATLAPTGDWGASDDALLIHALKLHFERNGYRWCAFGDGEQPQHRYGVVIFPEHVDWVEAGMDWQTSDREVIAWCTEAAEWLETGSRGERS